MNGMGTRDITDKDLMALYKSRLKDRAQSVTRRRRQVESSPKQMSTLLDQFFGQDSQAARKIDEGRALIAWETYVGDVAARYSHAERIRGDQLVVRVVDPLWMQQLSLLKHGLLKKYAEDFPRLNLRDIFFTRR